MYLFPVERPDDYEGMKKAWSCLHKLVRAGKVAAAWAVEAGGVAEGVMKMSFGNRVGFCADGGYRPPGTAICPAPLWPS